MSIQDLRKRAVLVGLAALWNEASAQGSGGPMGGGGTGPGGTRGAPPGGVRGPPAGIGPPRSLEDLLPADFMTRLHVQLVAQRGVMGLAPGAQSESYDRVVADVREVSRQNERRFWRIAGRNEASVSASASLEQMLASDLREEDERAHAIRDLLESHAQLKSALGEAQRDRLSSLIGEAMRSLQDRTRRPPPHGPVVE